MKAAELRQSILQAAVQGKLVSQDIHDEPASILLERIRAEKARFVKEGKLKKVGVCLPVFEDEYLYDLPETWIWCKLCSIVIDVFTGPFGSMLHKSDYVAKGIPLVNPMNIVSQRIVPSAKMMVSEETRNRLSSYVLSTGDMVVARRGELGRCAIVTNDENGWICGTGSFYLKLPTCIDAEYFALVFRSDQTKQQLNSESVGATMSNLNHQILNNVLISLPPLAEQQRIVSKVDELLALCNELEAAEKALDKLEDGFTDNLPKAILQAAVQGKLVPQNIHEKPASALLERIRTEKKQLIKDGKLKKEKPLPSITEDKIPYELPNGWEWCRLGEICDLVMGQSPNGTSVSTCSNGIEFHQGKTYFTDRFLRPSGSYTSNPSKIAQPNSVLLAVRAPVGVVNITQREICIGRGLCAIRPMASMTTELLYYFLQAMESQFVSKATGTTFVAITGEIVKNQCLPLPSLAEQQRIVAKVDELIALCDELKAIREFPIEPAASTAVVLDFPQPKQEETLLAARGEIGEGLSPEARKAIADLFAEDE